MSAAGCGQLNLSNITLHGSHNLNSTHVSRAEAAFFRFAFRFSFILLKFPIAISFFSNLPLSGANKFQ